MSHIIDKLFFTQKSPEKFADGHGITTEENRDWERAYRGRWAHDKVVRFNAWGKLHRVVQLEDLCQKRASDVETQHTDYPRTRPDLPNHEPRGCSRGASYSWYLYSAARLKYPMIRARLLKLWRAAKAKHPDPVDA